MEIILYNLYKYNIKVLIFMIKFKKEKYKRNKTIVEKNCKNILEVLIKNFWENLENLEITLIKFYYSITYEFALSWETCENFAKKFTIF